MNEKKREPTTIRAALAAFHPLGSLSFQEFAARISETAEAAKLQGANLVMFPELIVQDLVDHSRGQENIGPQVKELSKHWLEFLSLAKNLSQRLGLIFYSGTFSRREGDQYFNSGALILPDGQYWVQDKMYLTPFEREWGLSCGKSLVVMETPWGHWANLTCYDCEIPELSSLLCDVAPTLILVPSTTETVAGFTRVRWTAQARAIEHKAFILHTATVGGPSPWTNYSQNALIGPFDEVMGGVIAESEINPNQMLLVEMDFANLQLSRSSSTVYPGRDQKMNKVEVKC